MSDLRVMGQHTSTCARHCKTVEGQWLFGQYTFSSSCEHIVSGHNVGKVTGVPHVGNLLYSLLKYREVMCACLLPLL